MTIAPEGFVLDPDGSAIDLGDPASVLQLSALTIPPARRVPQWVTNGDSDGSALVRPPFYGPRECEMQVRVQASSGDAAMSAIGVLATKLQEAAILAGGGGDGLPFLWTPTGATVGKTGYMLLAEITDMPVTVDAAWFAHHPILTIAFTCKPFLYGDEVTESARTSTAPLLTFEVANVPGDVAAEARLVITDESSQARRHVEWGLECVNYTPSSPAPLFIDSGSLITSGYAGVAGSLTGAYAGSAINGTLLPQPIAMCGVGTALPHVGTFRAKARVYADGTDQYWRLSWRSGDGAAAQNDWAQPVTSFGFSEIDLGTVTVPEADAGAQAWSGQIEAFTSRAAAEGSVDYLELFPAAEGYGLLNAPYVYSPGIATGYDDFTTLAAGTALNGRTAPAGGAWATSGVATDFVGVGSAGVVRSTSGVEASQRVALLGSATPSDVEVGIDADVVGSGVGYASVIARWTNSSNYLYAVYFGRVGALTLVKVVSGTPVPLYVKTFAAPSITVRLRLVAYQSGRVIAWLLDTTGSALIAPLDTTDPVLATGGALATGKSGFADQAITGASTRTYDNFYVATPAAEPVTIHSGKSIEIRSDSNLRQSADGTTYGDISSRGSRLFIPPAGDADRTTRIAVRATRNDPDVLPDTPLGDNLQAQLHYTPRFLVVPWS